LEARRKRPELVLLNGYEFDLITYLQAGYDGLLLGGGIFNGYIAGLIMKAVAENNLPRAEKLQARLVRMLYTVFGGKDIKCWMAGQKQLLVELGIFRTRNSYLNYPLTAKCARDIKAVVKRNADVLLP
jgi:4-hydroxy-tetrahydrodipicolinate synthase